MRCRTLWPICAAGLLVLLAGCNNSSAAQDYTAPGAVAPPAAPAPSAAPAAVAPSPPAVGRPMTPAQKQYKNLCQSGRLKNGCELYTDSSLKLQGIDPDS